MHPRAELGHRPRDTDRHGARRHRDQTGTVEETGGLTRILYQFRTRGGDFDATFILWSPMTRHFKRTLDFDAPGSDRATSFVYQRASLNGALKTKLVNDCLSDAVVYSGQHGDPFALR